MNKKRNELLVEIPKIGEILLEPFTYDNGRKGYMFIGENLNSNLTLNMSGVDTELIILKMYDGVENIANHLLTKTDMFEKKSIVNIGRNFGQVVELNKDYYEK